jgi:hypothetical protein
MKINVFNNEEHLEQTGPTYIRQLGLFQYSDGTAVHCNVLWDSEAMKNGLLTINDLDEEDIL